MAWLRQIHGEGACRKRCSPSKPEILKPSQKILLDSAAHPINGKSETSHGTGRSRSECPTLSSSSGQRFCGEKLDKGGSLGPCSMGLLPCSADSSRCPCGTVDRTRAGGGGPLGSAQAISGLISGGHGIPDGILTSLSSAIQRRGQQTARQADMPTTHSFPSIHG